MVKFCIGSPKATVFIKSPQKTKIISFNPPVDIEISTEKSNNFFIYNHSMTKRMDTTFDKDIGDVELYSPGQTWNHGTDAQVACPSPGVTILTDSVHFEGKRIYSNFDEYAPEKDPYANNSGVCSYRIYYALYRLKITDEKGIILNRLFNEQPTFDVVCGDGRCPAGHQECPHKEYPGYCCIPCASTASKIKKLASKVGKNG